jgi:hypothetical protein
MPRHEPFKRLEPGNPPPRREVRLLTAVSGLSGTTYPAGTRVTVTGRGESVDAFVAGDWLPLHWWEYAERHPGELPPDH